MHSDKERGRFSSDDESVSFLRRLFFVCSADFVSIVDSEKQRETEKPITKMTSLLGDVNTASREFIF